MGTGGLSPAGPCLQGEGLAAARGLLPSLAPPGCLLGLRLGGHFPGERPLLRPPARLVPSAVWHYGGERSAGGFQRRVAGQIPQHQRQIPVNVRVRNGGGLAVGRRGLTALSGCDAAPRPVNSGLANLIISSVGFHLPPGRDAGVVPG